MSNKPTGKALARSAALPLQPPPPSLPASVALAIEDPVEVERDGTLVPGTWRPPEHRILPERIDEARRWLELNLAPCGDAGVHKALMPLLLSTTMPHTAGLEDKTLKALFAEKSAEYTRHLRELPIDILEAACDQCAKASPFFPAVADIFRHARPPLEKRQRQRDRVDRMMRAKDAPKGAEPFTPEPEEVRLRGNVARYLKHRDGFLGPTLRANAVAAEQRLAEIENRAPADWATEQATQPTPPSVAQPSRAAPPPPTIEGEFERVASPEPWHAGEPVYQPRAEEPPLPDAIPE